ncbi:MAG TPA: phosphodiesterase YaeI [Candidatus Didemnitutus sp.]|jgi:hypothetical protein
MGRLISRRAFLGGILAATTGTGGYARLVEPEWLDVTHRRVVLGPAPGVTLRVLHLSDLHASDVVPLALLQRAVTLGLAQRPDVIFVTGDFVTRRWNDFAAYAEILRPLSAAAPTFACPGNHDGGSWAARIGGYADLSRVGELATAAGIDLLCNQAREISIAGRTWQIIGVGDYWSGACHPDIAFAGLSARLDVTRLVLSHNPDSKDLLLPREWPIAFFGHTHGGQFRLPILGAPFAPVQDKRFIAGLYRWNDRWLHVSRGVGNLHGIRFNCRPEVTLLELS